MRRFVLGVIVLLSAVAAFAAEPLAARVVVYQRLPQLAEDGSAPEPQMPGAVVAAPDGGWPTSYDAVRQVLTKRKAGKMNVAIVAIHPATPIKKEKSAAFFIGEIGRPVEVDTGGDVLLPNGKHKKVALKANTTTIFGAPDEMTYVAVTLLPAAAATDDTIVIMNGEKPLNIVSRVEPKYPSIEALKHRTGMVLTQLRVNPDGSVGNVSVLEKGPPQIDAAAVDALKQWKFEPPTHEGKPVTAYMIMTTAYRIE